MYKKLLALFICFTINLTCAFALDDGLKFDKSYAQQVQKERAAISNALILSPEQTECKNQIARKYSKLLDEKFDALSEANIELKLLKAKNVSCDEINAQEKTINSLKKDINDLIAQENKEFKKILDEAELIVPDGIGIKIGLKLKGYSVERIPGIDFTRTLLDWCAKNNKPIAIIGSKEEVISKAVENLKNEISGLDIVYYHNGYFDNNDEIYNSLKEANARLILVALGSPKQEFFIYNAKKILPPCLMIGIGGSLDVWSGNVKRAPKIFQTLCIEWLYRTICQPERFKRIFPTIPLFLWKVITYKKEK